MGGLFRLKLNEFISSPLLEKIHDYLEKSKNKQKIYIFVPYIKIKYLEKLLEGIQNNVVIITTWDINDLISGSSDITIYHWCKKNGNFLYIHDKIHLKVYSINLESAIVASGNVSERGLMPDKNYEAGVLVEKIMIENRLYLEKIKKEAIFVDDYVYQQYLENYEICKKESKKPQKFSQPKIKSKEELFLRSALPMTDSMEDVIQGYLQMEPNQPPSENTEIVNCIFHDLANYEIIDDLSKEWIVEEKLSEEEIREKLIEKFLSHPFTKKIMDEIDNHERKHFGMIKNWIRDHCTEVPLPRPWEFNKNTEILMQWLVESGEYEKFYVGQHTPSIQRVKNSSQNKNKEYENMVIKILDEPGKTISQIKEIYTKLSLNINDEPSDPNELKNAGEPIWHYKHEMDKEITRRFSLSDEEIGEKNSRGKLYRKIAFIMGELNKEELIKMWNYKKYNEKATSDGVWRLTEKGRKKIEKS